MKTYDLKLPETAVQTIWNTLMDQPGKTAYPVLRMLENQLASQGAFSEPGALPKEKADEAADSA